MDSEEKEKKLKTKLFDMTSRYNENKYEIEVLYGDNSSAEEATTERIEGMRIENKNNESDIEVDKVKAEIRNKENDMESKISDLLKELTQEKKTREEKQNEALRSAIKNLTRKPRRAAVRYDVREIEELISKNDDLSEIKELISRTNLASATDNDGWLFLLTLEYNNKLNEKTDDVNRLAKKNNKLSAKLYKVREVNNSQIKELEETLASCTNQLKACKQKILKTKVRELENTN